MVWNSHLKHQSLRGSWYDVSHLYKGYYGSFVISNRRITLKVAIQIRAAKWQPLIYFAPFLSGVIQTYDNYRVAVGLLVGQGWERKRPTLPKLRREKTRP